MSMSALKTATILLVAFGVVATGAGVLAYQSPVQKPAAAVEAPAKPEWGETPKPDQPKPIATDGNLVDFKGGKLNADGDSTATIASLTQARLKAAEEFLEKVTKIYLEQPKAFDQQFVRSQALRVLEARRDLDPGKANQIGALEDYHKFMRTVEATEKARGNNDQLPLAEYYRLEAELWLAHARAGKEPSLPGSRTGSGTGTGSGNRPGTDPRSQAVLAKLEEPIAMSFPSPTPLEDVLKYIRQATADAAHQGIQIYVDPVDPTEEKSLHEELMKTPITMDLEGVPLRRTLKLIADQLHMGYGIKDGVVMFVAPDMRRRNWHELMVMEESFPETSPLALEVERAKRGELSPAEIEQLSERLRSIEEVAKRYRSIRMQGMVVNAPGGMNPGTQPPVPAQQAPAR
jgi:hypothetical protein